MSWKGYSSRSVCVYLCYPSNCSLDLYIENKVPLGFSCHMICVDFVENALFKSHFGDICLLSSLLDELSIDERDSNHFIWRLIVCRSSDNSCNSTDSSLLTVDD